MKPASTLHNPHLQGDAFFWQAGPVGVLLIHGFTATTAEVRMLGAILHQHGYTISGPLLPGHNTHPDDLNRVRWQDWVQEVESAYQHLKSTCDRVFVGGESTGGLLALYLAIQHPEAAGILAYAPALRLALSRFDHFRMHLLAPFISSVPKESLDAEANWQGYPVNPLKGAVQLIKLQNVVAPRLGEIKQPLLVMQGRLDITVHPSVPEQIASHVSSSIVEIHWMENSSHVVIIDQEIEQAAQITERFIERALAEAS